MVYTRLDLDVFIVSHAACYNEATDGQLIKPYTYVHVRCEYMCFRADGQLYSMIIVDTLLTIAIAIGLRECQGGWTRTDALIKRIIM
jgi:hypothetical protein